MRDLRLGAGSPCIDAGNPEIYDPDGTRSDMGALPYDPGATAAEPAITWGRVKAAWPPRTR